jgi:hypothetical protein
MNKVNLADKFALFSDHWNPRVVGELNGQQVRLVTDAAGLTSMPTNSFFKIVRKLQTTATQTPKRCGAEPSLWQRKGRGGSNVRES